MNEIKYELKSMGAKNDGEEFLVVIKIPTSYGWIDNVKIVVDENTFNLDYLKQEDGYAIFTKNIYLKTNALYKYYFNFYINGEEKSFIKDKMYNNKITDYNLKEKISSNYEIPNWAKGKIMYHIFVDCFNRNKSIMIKDMPRRHIYANWSDEVLIGPDEEGIWNNYFYGGNLLGIIDKLDYIKSLGTSIIYLSPIVYSQSNHRYDTANYELVDPYVGSNEDLQKLCDEAHKRGMKIILDAVFNHTGNDSIYFNEFNTFPIKGAYQSKDSIYSSFYKYTDDGDFTYWWGMKNLPVCDKDSQKWQEYITGPDGIIDKWFKLGIDGLRLDVADELSDEFIELIRKSVKRNKEDGFILGEVWKNPMRMNRGYIKSGKGMDSVMNYNFISSLIKYFRYGNYQELYDKIMEIKNEYPDEVINSLMNFTSTHDITRAINLWDEFIFNKYGEWSWNLIDERHEFSKNYKMDLSKYEQYKKIYMSYIFFLTFYPGNLSIFYGDEVGIDGIGNLNNRKTFPWNNIDLELLEFFKYMGYIRNNEQFLAVASFNLDYICDKYVTFERIKEDEKVFVAINRTDEDILFSYPKCYHDSSKIYTLKRSIPGKLGPYGGIALKK